MTLAYESPLDFAPGDQWKYSNTGYVILGALVRKVVGPVLRRRPARAGVQAARHDDRARHQRGGHRAASGRGISARERRPQESGVGRSAAEHDGGRLALPLAARSHRVGSRPSRRSAAESRELERGLLAGATEQRTPVTRTASAGASSGSVPSSVRRHGGSWQGFKTFIARYSGPGSDDLSVIALANLAQAQPAAHRGRHRRALHPEAAREPRLDDHRRDGRRRHGGAAAARRRAHRRRHDSRGRGRHAATRRSGHRRNRSRRSRPASSIAHNHSTEGLERRARRRDADLAGHHDRAPRSGRQLAAARSATIWRDAGRRRRR